MAQDYGVSLPDEEVGSKGGSMAVCERDGVTIPYQRIAVSGMPVLFVPGACPAPCRGYDADR
jgi:hypothetical protein